MAPANIQNEPEQFSTTQENIPQNTTNASGTRQPQTPNLRKQLTIPNPANPAFGTIVKPVGSYPSALKTCRPEDLNIFRNSQMPYLIHELLKLTATFHRNRVHGRAAFTRTIRPANIKPKPVNQQAIKKKLLHVWPGFQNHHSLPQTQIRVINRSVHSQKKTGI
jgi:hypothetical protein